MPTTHLNNLLTFAARAACVLLFAFLMPDARWVAAQGPLESLPAPPGRAKRESAPRRKERKETSSQPRMVTFRVETEQAACQVYVNGKYRGETDARGGLALKLPPGVYSISVKKAGHRPREESVNTALVRSRHLPLQPLTYAVTVTTRPSNADVYLDGTYAGRSGSAGRVTLPRVSQGEHRLTVRAEGFLSYIKPFKVMRDESIVAELVPDPVRVAVGEMWRLTALGDIEGALNAYRKLPSVRSGEPPVRTALAATLARLDKVAQGYYGSLGPDGLRIGPEEAWRMMRLFEQAAALRTSDLKLSSLAHYWAAKYYDLIAMAEAGAGRESEARGRVRAALGLVARPAPGLGWMNYDAGWCFYRLRDFAAAEESFRAAAGSLPSPAWLGYALSRLHLEQAEGEPDPSRKRWHLTVAVAESSSALTADGNYALAFATRAVAQSKLSKQKEAVADGLAATRLSPRSAYAHYGLGYAYYSRKKYREARRAFESALTAEEDRLDEPTQRLIRALLENTRR